MFHLMGINKIVLIHPPYFRLYNNTFSFNRYPLSLGYLAGTIKAKSKWDVTAYNADFAPQTTIGNDHVTFSYQTSKGYANYLANLNNPQAPIWAEVAAAIRELNPAVVGISAMSQNFRSASVVAKIVKEINGDTIVVVGGPHPSMVGAELLNCQDIDIGVMGEGERTIIELLDAIETGKSLDQIKGLVFRKNGMPVANPRREFIKDLDTLCFPHETAEEVLKDFGLYPKSAFGTIFSARGCPYACTFCGSYRIWSRAPRLRSPQNIIEEITNLQKMGIKSLRFTDDTFGLNAKWIEELCNGIIQQCPDLNWKCEMNINLINDKLLSLLKSAGCHMIEVGIESGDDTMLKVMKKNITTEQALEACRLINKHRIELQTYFILGFPQETEESLQKTRELIKKINGYIWISIFSPFPGTEIYQSCRDAGTISETYDISLHNFQSLDSFCTNIPPKRFKEIATTIIREVDKKNGRNRIKRIFSVNTLWRIKELGIRQAIRKGLRIILSRVIFNK